VWLGVCCYGVAVVGVVPLGHHLILIILGSFEIVGVSRCHSITLGMLAPIALVRPALTIRVLAPGVRLGKMGLVTDSKAR